MGEATFGIGILGAASIAKKNARAIAKCRNGAGVSGLLGVNLAVLSIAIQTHFANVPSNGARCKTMIDCAVPM